MKTSQVYKTCDVCLPASILSEVEGSAVGRSSLASIKSAPFDFAQDACCLHRLLRHSIDDLFHQQLLFIDAPHGVFDLGFADGEVVETVAR